MLRSMVCLLLAPCAVAGAQSDYFNLDAGRPTRIEDAVPTPRYELDLQLVPIRYELLSNGATRWRADPKLAYGVAPFTEIELRAPLLVIDPHAAGSPITTGLGGLALGALHAFGVETGQVPALALAAEYLAPAGSLAARTGSFSLKAIATKTFALGRLHANAGIGSWSIRAPTGTSAQCPRFRVPGGPPVPGCDNSQPAIPDSPCDMIPADPAPVSTDARATAPVASAQVAGAPVDAPPPTTGRRWMAGIGMDHAFALSSTLVTGDVVAERFIDLYAFTDWSAELGVRHQWSPQLTMDLGFARHFEGLLRSNAIVFGLAYGTPVQPRPIGQVRE